MAVKYCRIKWCHLSVKLKIAQCFLKKKILIGVKLIAVILLEPHRCLKSRFWFFVLRAPIILPCNRHKSGISFWYPSITFVLVLFNVSLNLFECERKRFNNMQVCDHISDGHLCFDRAFMCPKLLTTLNIQIFSFKSSTPLLGMICIHLLLFLEVHSWFLVAIFFCPQKYLSNTCIYWNSPKYGSSLLLLYSWLIKAVSRI